MMLNYILRLFKPINYEKVYVCTNNVIDLDLHLNLYCFFKGDKVTVSPNYTETGVIIEKYQPKINELMLLHGIRDDRKIYFIDILRFKKYFKEKDNER